VAVAAALAISPRLWLLDEPTAYLDPNGRAAVHRLFTSLRVPASALYVAADAEEYELGDRLVVLDRGRISADGPPGEVIGSGALAQAGLEPPRRWRLKNRKAALLPERNENGGERVHSPQAGEPVLSAKAVRAHRRELLGPQRLVLDGVDLSVRPGEIVAVVGPGGAGKSSLLEVLAGTIEPSEGTVHWRGEPPGRQRGRTGIAFQFPERSFFAETIEEEVAYGALNLGADRGQARQRMLQALRRLDLPIGEEFLRRSPFDLSGGEARRVALAAVAVLEPELWLLDEPTAGLDPKDADAVSRLVAGEAAAGRTVIVAGHDVDRFADWTARWLVLNEGRVLFDGDPREAWAGEGLPGYSRVPATVAVWREAGGDPRELDAMTPAHVAARLQERT
jgi:energy-coupling factor transport system ATP-binding protein